MAAVKAWRNLSVMKALAVHKKGYASRCYSSGYSNIPIQFSRDLKKLMTLSTNL